MSEPPSPDDLLPEDLLDSPVIQDVIHRLKLLDHAQNLRLRAEADLEQARSFGRMGDRGGETHYLHRAFWNLRAGRRLQAEAGEGLIPPNLVAEPTLDLLYHYRGFGNAPSHCRIRVYEPREAPLVVVATELPDNQGTSITNYAEPLAMAIAQLLEASRETFLWIEHYLERGTLPHQRENFARVLFSGRSSSTRWEHLTREQVEELIGGKLANEQPKWQNKPHPQP